ncbi:MAG TPA: 4,5-DOPA dioxygenase extradiol [Sphingomicrobium sp.]|jgi:4,5-DOPA dioxygenase extradiol|nr:4,5-DOPA dioxygenase extradiol [Sphingomicrobium sp.]
MATLPAFFIGHGSPMNTLELNGFTRGWRRIGKSLSRPRAILVVSAHWFFGATAVTAMERPRTIHDFYGFPPELFAFDYSAPGAPDVAAEVIEAVKPVWCGLDRDQWGLDHGAWSVLAHLFADADIPVVQLSINALKPLDYHVELGRKLASLRDRDILVIGSGNIVHNLRRVQWDKPDSAFDWAERFDDAVMEQLATNPGDILTVTEHADYALAVPTPDHFIPLLYIAGLAAESGGTMEPFLKGYAMGSLSMTCYGVGADLRCVEAEGAAELPEGVPPDQTNI